MDLTSGDAVFAHLAAIEDDEERSASLSGTIADACDLDKPANTLRWVYDGIVKHDLAASLDGLNIVPRLLPIADPAAEDLLNLAAIHCSARELMIACQELVERVSIITEESDEEDDKEPNEKSLKPIPQLARIIGLYAVVIPRLKLRKKSALDTIRPALEELLSVIPSQQVPDHATGRQLLVSCSNLIVSVDDWVAASVVASEDSAACRDTLENFITSLTSSLSEVIDSQLAQRAFKECFPRLRLPSERDNQSEWQPGQDAVETVLNALNHISRPPSSTKTPTLGTLILLAHSHCSLPGPALAHLFPLILLSIQTNRALDSTLALLLRTLHPPTAALPAEHALPLAHLLPLLACAHPDAPTRHIAFRTLALVLARAPPPLRFALLRDMLAPAPTDGREDTEGEEGAEGVPPQMQAAAVGLVKEALVEALGSGGPFASPHFVSAFGPLVFRARLDALDSEYGLARMTECLGLYYVLLKLDTRNLTGARDGHTLASVRGSLLDPLRIWLAEQDDDGQDLRLAPLHLGLQRVDEALLVI